MKFNLNNSEVKRILEMHANLKKKPLVLEQSSDSKTELESMVKKGCIKNGTLQSLKDTKITPEKWSIKQVSASNPNRKRYFLITGEVLLFDGTKLTKLPGNWDVNACRTKEMSQVLDISSTQEIEKGGWVTIDQAKKDNLDLTPGMFETKYFGGIPYYRKAGITIGGSGSAAQKEVIDYITKKYGERFVRGVNNYDPTKVPPYCWSFRGQDPLVDPEWEPFRVVGGKDYGVKEGLEILINPECYQSIRGKAKEIVSAEILNKDVDNKTCKDNILKYYQLYKSEPNPKSISFQEMKNTVISCKVKFCATNPGPNGECNGKWNLGLMGGSRKMDDFIDFFSLVPGNPIANLRYGSKDPYRIIIPPLPEEQKKRP